MKQTWKIFHCTGYLYLRTLTYEVDCVFTNHSFEMPQLVINEQQKLETAEFLPIIQLIRIFSLLSRDN